MAWERCSRCLELVDITGVILWEGLCEICTDELHKEKKEKLENDEIINDLQELNEQSMVETMHTMNELYMNQ
jgi:hypothetical protein